VDDAATDKMSVGLNNVGLLMTVWGNVTAVNDLGTYDSYFYVDDGSGLRDGTTDPYTDAPNIGIRCRPAQEFGAATVPEQGIYVTVTGVMGVHQIDDKNTRLLWTSEWH
jgi:hypothetical protein